MNNIESNFVPYQIAVDMKSIGFDEPCFAIWSGFDENNFSVTDTVRLFSSKFSIDGTQSNTLYINPTDNRVSAPLWQQSFLYLWNKTEKYIIPIPNDDIEWLCMGKKFKTYEEARLECLKKLIEICSKLK